MLLFLFTKNEENSTKTVKKNVSIFPHNLTYCIKGKTSLVFIIPVKCLNYHWIVCIWFLRTTLHLCCMESSWFDLEYDVQCSQSMSRQKSSAADKSSPGLSKHSTGVGWGLQLIRGIVSRLQLPKHPQKIPEQAFSSTGSIIFSEDDYINL